MYRRTFARFLGLVLMVSALLTGSEFGFAARKLIPNKTTTDAAGRTHVRPAGRISDAQRRAAARQRKAVRDNGLVPSRRTEGSCEKGPRFRTLNIGRPAGLQPDS